MKLGASSIWDFSYGTVLLKKFFLNENIPSILKSKDLMITNSFVLFGSETRSWPRGYPIEDIDLNDIPNLIHLLILNHGTSQLLIFYKIKNQMLIQFLEENI
jgi:hypothetical protein